MAIRQNTFLLKRSNVPNKIPQLTGLTLGEMALNVSDAKLYSLFTSGTTGATEVREIGWNRIHRTGDTVTGDFNFFGDISISGSSLPNGYALSVTGDTSLQSLTATTIYTDYIDFNNNLSPIPTNLEGRVFWDEDNGSLTLGMHGSQVSQQIGLEQYYYIKNQSGATIENGKVVRAAGTLGNSGRILGEYMIADGTIPYYFTLGIATEDILNGEDGYVTEFGLVRGINTTGSLYGETWVDGTILYVSPTISGGLTSVEPIEPNFKIQIAIVIKANNNGSLFVRPSLGYNLGDLHNLQTSGQTNGDLISYNSSQGYWEYTKTLNGSYTITGDTTVGGNLTVSGNSGINWFNSNTSSDLVRITQTGTGNAFVVEDSTNPDSTPFIINTSGNTSIGSTSFFTTPGSGLGSKLSLSLGSAGYPYTGLPISTVMAIESNQTTSIGLFSPDLSSSQIYFGTPGDGFGAFLRWDFTNKNLLLSTASSGGKVVFQTGTGTEAARIDQNGNFGIGLTSPTQKLEVSGNTIVSGTISGGTMVITTQPTSGYTTTQILMRNSTTGQVEITDNTSPSIYNYGMTYAMSTFNYLT
jgi:hypothetical protein